MSEALNEEIDVSATLLAPVLKNGFPFVILDYADITWPGAVLGPYVLDDVAKLYWRTREWDVTGSVTVDYTNAGSHTVVGTFAGAMDVRQFVPADWPITLPLVPAPSPKWGVIAAPRAGTLEGTYSNDGGADEPAFIELSLFPTGEEVYQVGSDNEYYIPALVTVRFPPLVTGSAVDVVADTTPGGSPPAGVITIDGQTFDIYGTGGVPACDLELTPGLEWSF